MKEKLTDLQRRRFLLSAGVGGAGAAVIVAGGGKAVQTPTPAASASGKSGGYSETAHVRNYYRTTRI